MSFAFALLLMMPSAAEPKPTVRAPRPSVRLWLRSVPRDDAIIRTAAPRSAPHKWVADADYPADKAPPEWLAFDLHLDIAVAADGSIAGCTATVTRVIDRAGSALDAEVRGRAQSLFASYACRLLRDRGAFRYAIDAEGVPLAASVPMLMSFSAVPVRPSAARRDAAPRPYRSMPRPLDASVLNFRGDAVLLANRDSRRAPAAELSIDTEGRVTRCHIVVSTGSDAGDAVICRQLRAAGFEPARDRGGKALPDGYYFAAMTIGASSQ